MFLGFLSLKNTVQGQIVSDGILQQNKNTFITQVHILRFP